MEISWCLEIVPIIRPRSIPAFFLTTNVDPECPRMLVRSCLVNESCCQSIHRLPFESHLIIDIQPTNSTGIAQSVLFQRLSVSQFRRIELLRQAFFHFPTATLLYEKLFSSKSVLVALVLHLNYHLRFIASGELCIGRTWELQSTEGLSPSVSLKPRITRVHVL